MNEISEQARAVIVDAWQRRPQKKGSEIAAYYGISPTVAYACLDEQYDMGSTNARRVLRVELERKQAERHGQELEVIHANMRYKGTRSH